MNNIAGYPLSTWRVVSEFNLPNRPDINNLLQTPIDTALKPFFLSPVDLGRIIKAVSGVVLDVVNRKPTASLTIRLLVADWTGDTFPGAERSLTPDAGPLDEYHQGWGFFLVTRGVSRNHLAGVTDAYIFELFLYPEGLV